MSKSEQARQIKARQPHLNNTVIGKHLGIEESTVRQALKAARAVERPPVTPEEAADLIIKIVRTNPAAPSELAAKIGCSIEVLTVALRTLEETHSLTYHSGLVGLGQPGFGAIDIKTLDGGEWNTFGLVSDTHLCCKEERLDALHAVYDIFQREKITQVFHAGNIVDGYIQKINGESVFSSTAHGQAQYVIDNYPKRAGIVTHFVTGDDHESWFMKDGFNFGAYLQMLAEREGRTDLNYLGHVEADVELISPGGSSIMKVQHPGGGSAYARSYTGQKQVESFQGGEKPQILVQGHYHVSNYMVERNIHVISMPGFQDQTIFARKKRLRMEIGGAVLKIKQNPKDGAITRCAVEFVMFFDRGYYKPFLRSDTQLVKGRITCKTK